MPEDFLPYPPIGSHGTIGDRRSAALVAADGCLDWLCLPRYDSPSLFGALLDAGRGGYWRLGPRKAVLGRQSWLEDSAVLVTRWQSPEGTLELRDTMLHPEDLRPTNAEARRIVLRQLRCTSGRMACRQVLRPRENFREGGLFRTATGGLVWDGLGLSLGIWSSLPLLVTSTDARADFELQEGEEVWCVLALDETPSGWNVERARAAQAETLAYWRGYLGALKLQGPQAAPLRRSALALHLLSYAPSGAYVAAPTSSLPERVGGELNWDYRFCWIRDGSLSAETLLSLGDTHAASRFLDWACELGSLVEAPLQVVYRVDGNTRLFEEFRPELDGYRHSRPVRFGNRAVGQRQIGSLGYLCQLVWRHFEAGGAWRAEYWELVRRIAEHTARAWVLPDSGIWELPGFAPYVESKVLAWVALDRAVKLAERLGYPREASRWRQAADELHTEVMELGWSESRQAFRQRYGAEALDASTLLIPIMGFLPASHPRVRANREAIARQLSLDGLIHRFIAKETPGLPPLPLGEYESAFLPCTFWLAANYALDGCEEEARAILARVEPLAGELGLFAEEADAKGFLGNMPQLFSHTAYVRATLALAGARVG